MSGHWDSKSMAACTYSINVHFLLAKSSRAGPSRKTRQARVADNVVPSTIDHEGNAMLVGLG